MFLKLLRTRFLRIFKVMMRLTLFFLITIKNIDKLLKYLFVFAIHTHINLLVIVLECLLLVSLLG